ncbi:MAG: hypothetical protein LBG72_05320, partial [Spirochaetaceae bacterium]|nr:hypothetical protein [Spirochaetaceae bacterium]
LLIQFAFHANCPLGKQRTSLCAILARFAYTVCVSRKLSAWVTGGINPCGACNYKYGFTGR